MSLVIYDLDGTLYDETRHFVYYAKLIRDGLPEDRRADYWRELELIWSHGHPLKIGRVYDAVRDLVLQVDDAMRVVAAWRWDGEALDEADVKQTYPEAIVCRMEGPFIAVGDGWWIPVVCARRQGMLDTYAYYVETKKRLHETSEWLQPIPGLADALREAGRVLPQIVATNSDREDAETLLRRLGLQDVVSGLYPSCNKPTDAKKWFRQICADWNVPLHKALSVGDNYLNDVMPALQLGMKGLLIDGGRFHEGAADSSRSVRVATIRDFIPWLRSRTERGQLPAGDPQLIPRKNERR